MSGIASLLTTWGKMEHMAEILTFRKPSLKEKHKGNTLCRRGHHKWAVDNSRQFDVKQGGLVTAYRCSRCGELKVKKH